MIVKDKEYDIVLTTIDSNEEEDSIFTNGNKEKSYKIFKTRAFQHLVHIGCVIMDSLVIEIVTNDKNGISKVLKKFVVKGKVTKDG